MTRKHIIKHPKIRNPVEALANTRHEFGEHGGVNMSIEASTTFTAMHPDVLSEMFTGKLGPDKGGCYLYGRHFNPTVYSLSKQLAALEGTESAYCTASGMAAISATASQAYSFSTGMMRRPSPSSTTIQISSPLPMVIWGSCACAAPMKARSRRGIASAVKRRLDAAKERDPHLGVEKVDEISREHV